MRKYAVPLIIVALAPILLTFQNCSGKFNAGSEEQFSIAATVPQITISQRPDNLINVRNPTVAFAVLSNAVAGTSQAICTLDDMAPASCEDHVDLLDLPDGDHALAIKAIDSLGNSSDALVVRFRVDATLPVVIVNSGPMAETSSKTAAVAFTATDNLSGIATIECSFDAATYAPCVSPQNFADLAEGSHALKIRAKDLAGNYSTEVTQAWSVDLSPPMVVITSGPASNTKVSLRSATFVFEGNDKGVSITNFMCSVDGGAADPCTSPMRYANFADGTHTFSVTAVDSVGNISVPATYTWDVGF